MVSLKCQQCSTAYSVSPYRASASKFCSRSCLALAARVQVSANCAVCGRGFQHISSRSNSAKYCSRACYYKAMHLKGSVECKCRHCGKKFLASPSHERVYCSRACVNKEARKTWKATFETVRKVMKRRGLLKECARCGYAANAQILGVHHIDRNRRNNVIDNLEVLCPNCHSLEHAKHTPHALKE